MFSNLFNPKTTFISGTFPVTWRQFWRIFWSKELPIEVEIEQDVTDRLTGVYVRLEHTKQAYNIGGEAIAFAEWVTQDIELKQDFYARRFTRIESSGMVKWIDNAPFQNKTRTTSEMYQLFKIEKLIDQSMRVDRIVAMLCDCMSITAAEAERTNIIQLIDQGMTDQDIYQKIAWG